MEKTAQLVMAIYEEKKNQRRAERIALRKGRLLTARIHEEIGDALGRILNT